MSEKMVPAEQARRGIQDMSRRVALLHMCYARMLVDALGEEKGKELIAKAIHSYGTKIGERTRARVEAQGLSNDPANAAFGSDLSPLGWDFNKVAVDGEPRIEVAGCVMAEIWREYEEEELGGLYCSVDPANMQAYNPDYTMVHVNKTLKGSPRCELAVRKLPR